jgi:hypothetical protein
MIKSAQIILVGTGENRVTWKTPSSAAFVPLQEPVAVLAFLHSPHTNAGMKQYECGCTQPLLRKGHDRGNTSVSKPKRFKTNCSARDWDGKDYLRIIPRVVW